MKYMIIQSINLGWGPAANMTSLDFPWVPFVSLFTTAVLLAPWPVSSGEATGSRGGVLDKVNALHMQIPTVVPLLPTKRPSQYQSGI